MLQLEPRVPVVVLLQVFLLDGHLSWKTNAEETSHEGPICPPDRPGQQDLHYQRQSSQTETQDRALGDGQCGKVTEATFVLEVPRPPEHSLAWTGSSSHVTQTVAQGQLVEILQIGGRLCQGCCPGPGQGVGWGEGIGTQGSHVTAPPAPTSMLWHVVAGVC